MTQSLQPERQRLVNVVANNIEKAMRLAGIRDLLRNVGSGARKSMMGSCVMTICSGSVVFPLRMTENRMPSAQRFSQARGRRRV
jgi:hypothetical protein